MVEGGLEKRHRGLKSNVKSILGYNEQLRVLLTFNHIIKSISAQINLSVSLSIFHCFSHPPTKRHMQWFEYLKEEWTLAFSLWAGGPEPVRKSICLCSGDVVAQSQWLLLQLFWWTVPGQQALSLALQTQDKARK